MEEQQSSSSVLILGKQYCPSSSLDCASYPNLFEKVAKQNNIGVKSQPFESYIAQDHTHFVKDRIIQDQISRTRRMTSQSLAVIETYALYKIIQEVNPRIFQQTVEFLHRLFHSSKIEKNGQAKFQFITIRQCLSAFSRNGFPKLYDHSMNLLRIRILQIINQFQSRKKKDKWNIRIEILAHYIKTIIEYQEYIPNKQNFELLKPDYLFDVLKIQRNIYKALKQKYFEANRDQVEFYDEETLNLSVLINTYYILQMRKRCQSFYYRFKEIASYLQNNRQTFLKEEIKRLRAYKQRYSSLKRKENIAGTFITFSEEYIRVINKKKKSFKPLSLMEIEQEAIILERLFIENAKELRNNEKIVYLMNKYKRKFNYYKVKFENYKSKMKQYNNNFDSLKKTYIAKQIRRNVNVAYENICKNYYYTTYIFVSRHYFQENIDNLLRKQLQYQQILYLNNVMNLIQSSHNKRQLIFMQVFQLTGQKTSEREKHILAMAIDVQGINYCKEFTKAVDFTFQFKKFTDKIVDNMYRSSIIINTGQHFRLEQYFDAKRCKKQKEIHILPCPALSCFPNPCQKIYFAARKFLKLSKNTKKDARLIERTQFYVEKIAQTSGKELVDMELKKSSLFLDFRNKNNEEISYYNQSSYFLKQETQITEDLMTFNTQRLREYLSTWKLYNQRIHNIRLKQIKLEEIRDEADRSHLLF